jgi:hypothetical protein
VWQKSLDWLAIVSGVIALLHFFFPRHGARAGDHVLNRWAERSKASTEKRIKKLEALLANVERFKVLTEFEDTVLIGLAAIVKILTGVPAIASILYVMFRQIEHQPLPQLWSFYLLLLVAIIATIGMRWDAYIGNTWRNHSERYRQNLRKNIDKLKIRLG